MRKEKEEYEGGNVGESSFTIEHYGVRGFTYKDKYDDVINVSGTDGHVYFKVPSPKGIEIHNEDAERFVQLVLEIMEHRKQW